MSDYSDEAIRARIKTELEAVEQDPEWEPRSAREFLKYDDVEERADIVAAYAHAGPEMDARQWCVDTWNDMTSQGFVPPIDELLDVYDDVLSRALDLHEKEHPEDYEDEDDDE